MKRLSDERIFPAMSRTSGLQGQLAPNSAHAAGATIIRKPTDQDYGGCNYSALDPEGHAGSYGSCDLWAE